MLCDTHCHLDFEWFDLDRDEVLERASQSGVVRILNPGIDLASSKKAVKLAESNGSIFAAIGVHPNDCGSWGSTTPLELNRLAESPKVVAIGEIGLDYYRKYSLPELQQRLFEVQLEIAAELDLPVVVHIRDEGGGGAPAQNDAFGMLKAHCARLKQKNRKSAEYPGVLHSFAGGLNAAAEALEMGFFIGIGGPVTYKNAGSVQEIAANLPVDCLLVETDAPFLSPASKRGKRNEPAHVLLVADEIARLRNMDSNDIFNITTRNAERLFRW